MAFGILIKFRLTLVSVSFCFIVYNMMFYVNPKPDSQLQQWKLVEIQMKNKEQNTVSDIFFSGDWFSLYSKPPRCTIPHILYIFLPHVGTAQISGTKLTRRQKDGCTVQADQKGVRH